MLPTILGVVRGIVVRSPGLTQGFLGGLKSVVGLNNEAYPQVCDQARRDAYTRMVDHAEDLGADAIIGVRYDATEFAQATTEVLAYGTAVKRGRGSRAAVCPGRNLPAGAE